MSRSRPSPSRLLLVAGVALTAAVAAGCPGHLEQFAWLPDGGAGGAAGGSGVPPGPAPVAGSGGTAATAPGGSGAPPAAPGPPAGPPAGTPRLDGGVEAGSPPDLAAPAAPAAPVPACATAAEITAKILMPRCAGCHGGAMPRAGLDLASPGAKARLLNVASRTCQGRVLISDQPSVGGLLFDKLAGPVNGCGMRMPLNGVPLTPAEIQCLKDWIKPTPAEPPAAPPTPPGMVPTPLCATAAEISSKILTPRCGPCHGVNTPAQGLDLVTMGAKARLLNVASRGCGGKPLIVSDPVVGGHLFDKLAGAVPGCGNQMPFGAPPLSATEIKCLKDWIRPTP
jgi:hypothetical protein